MRWRQGQWPYRAPGHSTLKNGDSVEVITDKNRVPSRDWLKFVKTAKARTRIKHYIRTVEMERAISLAKEHVGEGRAAGSASTFRRPSRTGDFLQAGRRNSTAGAWMNSWLR